MWIRLSLERLEDRFVPANLSWVGPANGLWSDMRNWNPAQLPGNGDILSFLPAAQGGSNTSSKMDLGGAGSYHIAGLNIDPAYTRTNTITLQNDLYVDVLNMSSGIIQPATGTTKSLKICQRTGGAISATNFGTSYFVGGAILADTSTFGEDRHRVTFVLAGSNTTALSANLSTDAFTAMEWRSGNITVSGGKTITVAGTFLALPG